VAETGPKETSLDESDRRNCKTGLLIDGRGSYSIDQQRYNFQFGGDAFWKSGRQEARHDFALCRIKRARPISGRPATAPPGLRTGASSAPRATPRASHADQFHQPRLFAHAFSRD